MNVVILTKDTAENRLLAEIYAQILTTKTTLQVQIKNHQTTAACLEALAAGEGDIYFDYTMLICSEALQMNSFAGMEDEDVYKQAYNTLRDNYDTTMYGTVGIDNGVVMVCLAENADAFGNMSGLASHAPSLTVGTYQAVADDKVNGLQPTCAEYGYQFAKTTVLAQEELYDALASGEIDVALVYQTDALLAYEEIAPLEDDKGFFVTYHGGPMCRKKSLWRHPSLPDMVNLISGRLDTQTVRSLLYQIQAEGKSYEEAAYQYLTETGVVY